MRIVFGAVLSRHPYVPGSVWNRMHWVTGLRKLGHEVLYLEQVHPDWCVDAAGQRCAYEDSITRTYFARTMERFGMSQAACQLYDGGESSSGMSLHSLKQFAKDADLLINQSGHITADCVLDNVKRRVYVDQDPVYTQLWRSEYGKDLNFARHDCFLTVGLNIGTALAKVPTGGVHWHPILPPMLLDYWPPAIDPSCRCFTTVASLYGGEVHFKGEYYKPKYEAMTLFAELAARTAQPLQAALKNLDPADPCVMALRERGWHLFDASEIGDLDAYRRFIQASRGEIGISKSAYVKGRSGWFSDRSLQYLASGKPVVTQSTGFEHIVPVGHGLFTFSTIDEAVAGIDSINADYAAHCRAARALAEEYFDYRKVLPRVLEACMSHDGGPSPSLDQEIVEHGKA